MAQLGTNQSCPSRSGAAGAGLSGLDAVSGAEYPADNQQTQSQEHQSHADADADVHIRSTIEAPAEPADQVDHRIEQRNGLPERRQHGDGVETAAQKGQRGNNHQRNDLQLLEAVCPDADDKAEQAEGDGTAP